MRKADTNKVAGRYYSLYKTASGSGAVVAGNAGLVAVFLPVMRSAAEMEEQLAGLYPSGSADCPETRLAADLLQRYFSGEQVKFDLPLDLSDCTSFQQVVYNTVANIPYGAVKTYAEVAEIMDRPKAPRGVGSAMARNPLPIIIPCHRVVGSSGGMTGYSAPGGVEMKKRLLRMEGVDLDLLRNRKKIAKTPAFGAE
jgi:methylated-DNA-[protein]-cysteine S-methyltransferase